MASPPREPVGRAPAEFPRSQPSTPPVGSVLFRDARRSKVGEEYTILSTEKDINFLNAKPPLLITESASEFASLRAALEQEIKPNGVIEQIYLEDMANIIWDILRLRRCKTGIINNAMCAALEGILEQLLSREDYENAFERSRPPESLPDLGLRTKRPASRSKNCSGNSRWTRMRSKPKRSGGPIQTLRGSIEC